MVTRPTMFDKPVMQATAEKMTPAVVEWLNYQGCDEEGITDITRDLQQAFEGAFNWDAYKIARELDDMGWSADTSLVDVLEEAESLARQEWDKAVRAWVKANNIRPAFKVGDLVQTRLRTNGFEGEVIRVDEELGRYLVHCPARGHVKTGVGTHGTYLSYEDAEEAGASSEPW